MNSKKPKGFIATGVKGFWINENQINRIENNVIYCNHGEVYNIREEIKEYETNRKL